MADPRADSKGNSRAITHLVSGRVVSASAQAVMVILLAFSVSPTSLGVTLTWFSIALVFSGVTDFGFTTVILRTQRMDPKKAHGLLGLDTAVSSILAILAISFLLMLESFGFARLGPLNLVNACLLILWCLVETLTEAGNMVQVGNNQSLKAGYSIALRRVIALALYVVFSLTPLKVIGFSTSLLLGALIAYAFLPKAWYKSGFATREIARELRPFAVLSAVGQLRNFDVPLMSAFFGAGATASYSLGARLANPVLIISGSIGNVLVSKGVKSSRRRLTILLAASIVAVATPVFLSFQLPASAFKFIQSIQPWMGQHQSQIILLVFSRFLLIALSSVLSSYLIANQESSLAAKANLVFASLGIGAIVLGGVLKSDVASTLEFTMAFFLAQVIFLAGRMFRSIGRGKVDQIS